MRRREFIALVGSAAAAWPSAARAQQPAIPLIAIINAGSEASTAKGYEAFRNDLRHRGYVEGRNIRYEYRFADGFLDRLPRLAEELVQLNPTIIVSAPMPTSVAVHQATKTIPIVMSTGADPVKFGLVQSLSRPGGNVTGLTNFAEALASKQLDVMRELRPGLTRVAVLINVENPLHVPQWRETQDAAAQASITLVPYEFHKPDDFEPVATFAQAKAEALLVPPDTTFTAHRRRIAQLAADAKLPAIYPTRLSVEDGGLMSYGPDSASALHMSALGGKADMTIATRDDSLALSSDLPRCAISVLGAIAKTTGPLNIDYGAVRLPVSAALSIAAMTRCTATASSKLGAERVPSRRSWAILA
jgi:putative ABC transport system substrate-binding protein